MNRRVTIWLGMLLACAAWCQAATRGVSATESRAPDNPNRTSEAENLLLAHNGPSWTLAFTDGRIFHDTNAEVLSHQVLTVPGSRDQVALWTERQGNQATPHYAVRVEGNDEILVHRTSYVLELGDEAFEPNYELPALPPDLVSGVDGNLYLVQFVTHPLQGFQDDVVRLGGRLYQYIANHTYIVEMPPHVRDLVAEQPYARWVAPYHPAWRLERAVRNALTDPTQADTAERYNILVFTGNAGKRDVAGRITNIGGLVDLPNAGANLLVATLTPEQVRTVVAMDEVHFVDYWRPLEPDMDIVRTTSGTDYVGALPTPGFAGHGVRGEVLDLGFDPNHPDFASRPLDIHGVSFPVRSHGTATSGIIFGDGALHWPARGLLPSAYGIIAAWDPFRASSDPNYTSRYAHTLELVDPNLPWQAVFQSASVGDSQTTTYTTTSAEIDRMLYDADLLLCQSQSNEGNQLSRPQAWAKNVLSVGGLYHYNDYDSTNDCWCGGASTGPATDGRIKPDLANYYDLVYTLYPLSQYRDFGGTSAATPITAGLAGLFFEMWHTGAFHGGVPQGTTVFDGRSHMTTAKAMLINTARQWTFYGLQHDRTRMHQGWGRADIGRMYDLRDNMLIIDEDPSELLIDQQTREYSVDVPAASYALRATLVYADPPGSPTSSSRQLINDLDLQLESPAGVLYRGNVGLAEGNWSQPGGDADRYNNVENVFIFTPTAGSWIVRVRATEVVTDQHHETPVTPEQPADVDFALIVSYEPADCDEDGVPDATEIVAGTASDCNGNGVDDNCEPDCNENGVPDECDITLGTSLDCNLNQIPDACELVGETAPDCNGNGVPDECDLDQGTSTDCDGNGVPDECQHQDCNQNGVFDTCDILYGTSTDCDQNGIPDECQTLVDCNQNGVLDACDIALGTSTDCNLNQIPDECEGDCNSNSVPDVCEDWVFFVDAQATGADTGLSWADAFTDVQAALAAADCPAQVTEIEIWVAAGTYRPDGGTRDRAIGFALMENVSLYGGFAGTEVTRGQRNVDANVTELSGDLLGDDGPGFANYADNTNNVVMGTDDGVLDGFTIQGGNASAYGARANGGGLYVDQYASPTLRNCTFLSNQALYGGGAVFNYRGTARFFNCRFLGNRATGGTACGGAIENGSTLFVAGCAFSGNTTPRFGGALHSSWSSTALVNCTFSGNYAGVSGGGLFFRRSYDVVTNCILWGNRDSSGTGQGAQVVNAFGDEYPLDINTCCVQGWDGSLGGTSNTGVDPALRDADGADDIAGTLDDDLRLQDGSPMIDFGDNAALTPFDLTVDLLGFDRVRDGDSDGEATVDLGAYEWFADCNANGVPDDVDLALGLSSDCNNNDIPDECDIADSSSHDCNADGVPDECQLGTLPAHVVVAASRKTHVGQDIQDIPIPVEAQVQYRDLASEPRNAGITQLRLTFTGNLPALVQAYGGAVYLSIEEQVCPGGTAADYQSYTGSAVPSYIVDPVNNILTINFAPGLENTRTYRLRLGAPGSGLPCQSIGLRGLYGDVNADGHVDSADVDAVEAVWNGSGFSPETDVDLSGATAQADRDIVQAISQGSDTCAP